MPPRRATKPTTRRPARARPRRVRLDNEQRRAQLLGLAKSAFSDRSYDEVSIDDIAREAKISKGLLYHYFPTKRDLYVAGLREIAGDLVTAVTSVSPLLAPIDKARAGLDAYLDHITRHNRAYVSLMRGGIGSDPEVAEVIESVRGQMFETFLKDQPFAPVLAGNPRFQTAVRGWIGFVERAVLDWCVHAQLDRTELRELLVAILGAILTVASPQVFART